MTPSAITINLFQFNIDLSGIAGFPAMPIDAGSSA